MLPCTILHTMLLNLLPSLLVWVEASAVSNFLHTVHSTLSSAAPKTMSTKRPAMMMMNDYPSRGLTYIINSNVAFDVYLLKGCDWLFEVCIF